MEQNTERSLEFEDLEKELEKRIGNTVQGRARTEVVSQVLSVFREESYRGPIPPPKYLAHYEDACPGSADRIIAMAEKSLSAQIEIATGSAKSDNFDRALGMWLGFASLAVLVVAAVICAIYEQPVVAGGFMAVGAIGTVGKFILGRKHASDIPDKK